MSKCSVTRDKYKAELEKPENAGIKKELDDLEARLDKDPDNTELIKEHENIEARLEQSKNAGVDKDKNANFENEDKKSNTVRTASNIAKDTKKMSPDDIGEFLGAGKDWHKTSAKSKFLNKFKKELKGDTNADFYVDKITNEVFLKSNRSGNWISTNQFFE